MNKSDIIRSIADTAGITSAQAALALEAVETSAITTLENSGEFVLPGFGKFEVVKTKARTGRNPKTGEALKIKAGKKVKFKAAKSLKDQVT